MSAIAERQTNQGTEVEMTHHELWRDISDLMRKFRVGNISLIRLKGEKITVRRSLTKTINEKDKQDELGYQIEVGFLEYVADDGGETIQFMDREKREDLKVVCPTDARSDKFRIEYSRHDADGSNSHFVNSNLALGEATRIIKDFS